MKFLESAVLLAVFPLKTFGFLSNIPQNNEIQRTCQVPMNNDVTSSAYRYSYGSTGIRKKESVKLRLMIDDDDDDFYFDDDDDDDEFQNGGYDTDTLNEYLKSRFTNNDAPLSQGLDSINWIKCEEKSAGRTNISKIRRDAKILPLFPLGEAYTPHSEHVMNIFEPRYREMYDHLENGDEDKQFIVTMTHPTENDTFAQYGIIMTVKEIMDVAEETEDEVKFIAKHSVTGRVKINQILNPEDWETADTYLRAEATILEDFGSTANSEPEVTSDDTSTTSTSDKLVLLRQNFAKLVDLQHELDQDVRFTKASTGSFANGAGNGKKGLWLTIRSWQQYAEQCLIIRQTELQDGFDIRLVEYLTKSMGANPDDIPSVVDVNDLPADLQKEAQEIERRTESELVPLQYELTLSIQKFLDATSHDERLDLLNYYVEQELQRLATKKTLKSMFSKIQTDDEEIEEDTLTDDQIEEWRRDIEKSFNIASESSSDTKKSSVKLPKIVEPQSIIVDEFDAFQ